MIRNARGLFYGICLALSVMLAACGVSPPSNLATSAIKVGDTPSPSTRLPIPSTTATLMNVTKTVASPTRTATLTASPPAPTIATPENRLTSEAPSGLCQQVPEPQLDRPSDQTAGIYLSGRFYLCSIATQSSFDLDKGVLGDQDASSSDIVLEVGKADIDNLIIYYISETNGAHVDESDASSPSPEHCAQLASSSIRLGFAVGAIGGVGCVVTNEGRVAVFHVERLDPYGAESLELSFVTWNKIVKK
jgi:hypothetical protein